MYKALRAYDSRVGCTKLSGPMPVGWDVQRPQVYAIWVGCTKASGLMPFGWDVQRPQGLCQLGGMYKGLRAYASRVGCTKASGLMPVPTTIYICRDNIDTDKVTEVWRG